MLPLADLTTRPEGKPACVPDVVNSLLHGVTKFVRECRGLLEDVHLTEADQRELAHHARETATTLELLIFELEHRG